MKAADRFSLTLDLACAAVAVLFSDRLAADLLERGAPSPELRKKRRRRILQEARPRIVFQMLRHGDHSVIAESGLCTWEEMRHAQSGADPCDLRIRVALRVVQSIGVYGSWLAGDSDWPTLCATRETLAREALAHMLRAGGSQ